MHEGCAVVEMKLCIFRVLRDERAKQISGGGILLGFQIESGEITRYFGIWRGFIEPVKCGDGFLRFALCGLELAQLKLRGCILRIGSQVFLQPGFSVREALLLEVEADETFDTVIVSRCSEL